MSPVEQIFKFVSKTEFKNMGNKHLKSLKVALKSKTTKHTKAPMTVTEAPNAAFNTVLIDY